MNKRQRRMVHALIALCIIVNIRTAICQSLQQIAASEKTNVVILITDDQGYGDMSCHGNPWLKTPNIDKLYEQSARLTDFHVSPTCAPTRAALLTGHYANRTGVWHTIGGRSLLREGEVTMADVFSANGYATGIFGKWHLGDNYPFRPQDRGFQEVLVHGGGGVGQGPDYWNNNYFDDTYLHNGKPEKFSGYCTDVWFENAVTFMDQKQKNGQPFFCYLATNAPHSPYNVDNAYADRYRHNESIPVPAFNGMISNIDDNVGRLLTYLETSELEENTLLIFMTDNGTAGGVAVKNGEVSKGYNAGMRGRKGSMYEGGHRVPCFMRWPQGGIASGKDVGGVTAHVDLLPTLVDLLQLKVSSPIAADGRSLKGLLLGNVDQLPLRTLITDSQRLEQPEKWRQSCVMQGAWRLINGKELYHISDDPEQRHDIAGQYPAKVNELRNDYEDWWTDISTVFDDAPAIALSTTHEPVTILRAHDMHMDEGYDLVPWNHDQIRQGMKTNGWYAVNVLEDGTYEFTIMRWPPEANTGILAGLDAEPGVAGTTVSSSKAGVSLDIRRAGISIAGKTYEQTVSADTGIGITFAIPVKSGKHKLRASFLDGEGQRFAPYYIMVKRKK